MQVIGAGLCVFTELTGCAVIAAVLVTAQFVHGGFTGTWLAWQDIRVFVFADELESPSGREMLSASLVPYVVLKDGRHIRLSGLTAGRFRARRSREKEQRMLDSLNLEVASHRGR